jgi:DNA-binding NarL/FixJ family response regulator
VKLTEKEKQVMELLVQGKRDREIGLLLGVRPRTVTHRIWSVCNKLGAETRAQAAVIFARDGTR